MIHIVVFNIVQLLVAGYALWRGGPPERAVAVAMLVAAAATEALPFNPHGSYRQVEWAAAAIDLLFFGVVTLVAARADRFWPMWVAALQLDAIAIHGVRAYDPGIVPLVYAWSSGQIAYPMMTLLAIGTIRHRQRERASGAEPGWSQHDRAFWSALR